MAIEFRVDRGLGLTERCRDLAEFMGLLRRGEAAILAGHLRRCPTCRAVARDAIRGLVSEGVPFEPPALLKRSAERVLRRTEETEATVSIEVAATSAGIRAVAGAPHLVTSDRMTARCTPTGIGYAPILEVEAIEGLFLLRLRAQHPRDGVAVLKAADGSPVVPARRIENPLAWSALRSGRYLLTIAGAEEIVTLGLTLDYSRRQERET
jgi:hypothetical protein